MREGNERDDRQGVGVPHHNKTHLHGKRQAGAQRHTHHGHGGGSHGREGYYALAAEAGTHLLFVGSRSCIRHKGVQKQDLQSQGKLTFLCLDEVDWITGGYLGLMEEAISEIAREKKPAKILVFGGCQIELLSTDYETMMREQSTTHGILVSFHKGCHLTGYGQDLS